MDNELQCIGKIRDVLVHGVKWNIDNYASLIADKGESFCVTSPSFDMLAATWNLILFPTASTDVLHSEPCDWKVQKRVRYYCCSISLKRKCSMIDDHEVYYELDLAPNGYFLKSFSGNVCFQGNDEAVTQKLRLEKFSMGRLVPNSIRVLLKIFPEESTIQCVNYLKNINISRTGVDQLSSEIQKLYVEGQDCDFKIRVQTKEFSVHKAILAARSPVLYSMLHHDMVEKNTGIVDIVDFEPDIFNDFLLYLYSGRVDDLSSKNVTKLFALSDKYDLQYLKKTCREHMLHEICVDQFCDVVELAVKYEEKELLKCSEDFFAKNIKSILLTKQWQEFLDKNSTVCNELLIKFVSNPPPQKNN